MTSTFAAVAATDPVFDLAEGVIWDDRAQRVRWVDIWKGRVLSATLSDRRLIDIDEIALGQTTGAVALAEDGGLLIAAARSLATVSPTGSVSFGPNLLGERRNVRFNDGSIDPHGAFVVGTLALDDSTDQEVLLRVQPDGTVETLRTGIGLSNGVGFSPDGSEIYHVDTAAGTLSRHSYGAGTFDVDEPWTLVPAEFPAYPDGLAVDAEGTLWVAQWGGASVRRHATSGKLLAIVSVDAAQASCPAFVGPALDLLAITTAQEGLEGFTDQAGAIFVADVEVSGLPAPRWSGSTTHPSWLTPPTELEPK